MTTISDSEFPEIKPQNDTNTQKSSQKKIFRIGELLIENAETQTEDNIYGEALTLTQKGKTYQMGSRRNNTRIIGTDQVLMENSYPSYVKINVGGQIIAIPHRANTTTSYSHTTDGYIGDSNQAHRGDCYLLAEINAIRNTKNGQKLLKQNCKENSDGSYTVTLPGAIKIRNEYKAKGLKCEVTGTYLISKAALEKAGTSLKYSQGDLEVVAFELAMEAYRAEMYITNKQNGISTNNNYSAQGNATHFVHANEGDILAGGQTWDAGFLLTGNKSEVYNGFKDKTHMANLELYQDGQYGYITRDEMSKRTGADISMYRKKYPVTNEVSSSSAEESSIDEMLDKYAGKEGNYAITFTVKVAKDGPDGTTVAGGGHALTVVKITDDIIYVANPWHPDKIEPIPRDEFKKMCTTIQAMPVEPTSNLQTSGILQYINSFNQTHSKK